MCHCVGLARCWMYQGPILGTVLLLDWRLAPNSGLVACSGNGEGVMVRANLCIASALGMAIPAKEHRTGVCFSMVDGNMELPTPCPRELIILSPYLPLAACTLTGLLWCFHAALGSFIPIKEIPAWGLWLPHWDDGTSVLGPCKSRVKYQHEMEILWTHSYLNHNNHVLTHTKRWVYSLQLCRSADILGHYENCD